MLKLQLNPHFLFNSLNTLSSLVHDDQARAAEFIRRLSDVYRYVLENHDRELLPLRSELEFIRSFTFLLELRFQGMIFFTFEVDDSVLDLKIAPMTMQLLVENTVKHNIASRNKPLFVTIRSGDHEVSVTNNLQPKEELPGTGVGLKNIASRYSFLSDRKVDITRDNLQFKVTIPLI
jgi:LytS/YehU family sensor histidine kinase